MTFSVASFARCTVRRTRNPARNGSVMATVREIEYLCFSEFLLSQPVHLILLRAQEVLKKLRLTSESRMPTRLSGKHSIVQYARIAYVAAIVIRSSLEILLLVLVS